MRKMQGYELFLLKSFKKSDNGKYPIWVLSEKKAFYWMFNMLDKMLPERNGYNITKSTRFQMEHAPDSRYLRLPELSHDMKYMLDSFCKTIEDLQKNVLSHYPAGRSVNIMGKEDREYWDVGCEKIRDVFNREPDPLRITEDGDVAKARRLVEAHGFTNPRYYVKKDDAIVFRVGKFNEDNYIVVMDRCVLVPPT